MSFDKTAYDNEFVRQNYDRVSITLPKGKKADLKAYADKSGISLNALTVKALEEFTGIPLSKD